MSWHLQPVEELVFHAEIQKRIQDRATVLQGAQEQDPLVARGSLWAEVLPTCLRVSSIEKVTPWTQSALCRRAGMAGVAGYVTVGIWRL